MKGSTVQQVVSEHAGEADADFGGDAGAISAVDATASFRSMLDGDLGEAEDDGEAPPKQAKRTQQQTPKPKKGQTPPPQVEEEDDEPVEEEEVEASADGDADQGEADGEEAEDDEFVLDSLDTVAKTLGLEPDSLLNEQIIETATGKTSIKSLIDGHNLRPAADHEINLARVATQRANQAFEDYSKQLGPAVQEMQALVHVLRQEMAADEKTLEALDRKAADGDGEAAIQMRHLLMAQRRREGLLARARQEFQAHGSRTMLDASRRMDDRVTEQMGLLQRSMPALLDPKKAEEFMGGLVQYLSSAYGFDDRSMSDLGTDYRMLVVAHKAKQWDEFQSKAAKGREEARAAEERKRTKGKPMVRVRGTSRRPAQQRAQDGYREKVGKLRQSGSLRDAASAFEGMI